MKNKKQQGFVLHLTMVLVVVLVVALVGIAGITVYKNQNDKKAAAQSYTALKSSPVTAGMYIAACKIYVETTKNFNVRFKYVPSNGESDFAFAYTKSGITTVTGEYRGATVGYKTAYTFKGTDFVYGIVQTNRGVGYSVNSLQNC